jgi:hypothetical protein
MSRQSVLNVTNPCGYMVISQSETTTHTDDVRARNAIGNHAAWYGSEKQANAMSVVAFSLDSHCYLQCCYFLLTSIQVDYQSAEYLLQMPMVEQR